MTQQAWLISPLFTGVFVTLGIILFFQLLVRSFVNHTNQGTQPLNYLVGRLSLLSVAYFSILGVYFEFAAAQTNQDVAFINFRLLLLSYVIIFLGQRTSLIVILTSIIARLLLLGPNASTWNFILLTIVMYLLFSINLHLVRKYQAKQYLLVAILDVIVQIFWFGLYFIHSKSLGIISLRDAFYYWVSFMIMNAFLYYGLMWLNNENDYLTTLVHQATFDPLTHLENYSVFKKDFTTQFEAFHHDNQPLAMITLDIDYFKRVNDQYGHLAGNKVLAAMGAILSEAVAKIPNAHAYRVGGEEFNILLPNTDLEEAHEFSRQLQAQIRQTTFSISDSKAIHITISMGVTTLRESDVTQNLLYERADQMLYHSKGEGRDRITVSQEEPHASLSSQPERE